MQGLDFTVVAPYWDLLLIGAWWTTVLTVSAGALSFFGGILFAVIVLYAPVIVAYPVRAFMWVFMGTPLLLQLFLIYFGLVQIGIDIPALAAGIVGLGLHFAVYNADIIRAMTTNGYKVSETEKTRGPIEAGYVADVIAVPGNPLDDVDALKNVRFVMKDGQVFKRDGVMTPAAFFHGGPVNGWRIR